MNGKYQPEERNKYIFMILVKDSSIHIMAGTSKMRSQSNIWETNKILKVTMTSCYKILIKNENINFTGKI